ncbi:rhizobactin siderophore biosynthesis protein RhbD [Aneurinibacillus danicus]|uniref:Lysine N-acyltransferase MbtK n=1 Tax=Aneurinibacillus danicus TaxID=267746 RepID=A0A511V1Z3_9BACL|nr:rhizobactin siderophore biosynthesis protein RhbD [Aneurinibacillus danicus]
MNSSYTQFDQDINKTISFVKVEYERDLHLLHRWMQEEHVIPFWKLNISLEKYKRHLEKFLNDQHQTLYLGCIEEIPMSYWEAYWVKGDIIEDYYPYDLFDQGIHLLIGEKEFLGKGYALPLLRAMVRFQFLTARTKKIVAEPDIRNKKMIHIFETCGFEPVKPIELPDKTGLLMFCHRENFERKWKHVFDTQRA